MIAMKQINNFFQKRLSSLRNYGVLNDSRNGAQKVDVGLRSVGAALPMLTLLKCLRFVGN